MRLQLDWIREQAKNRPPGYYEEVTARGAIIGEELEISREDLDALYLKYRGKGLGDTVASIAQPIAGFIDAVLGTNLKNCGGCKDRRDWLNDKFPG